MTISNSAARALGHREPVPSEVLSAEELPSFDSVYARYFDFVWSSALRLGTTPSAIDDVVQEIFMVIHGKLSTLKQPSSLRSWIYGIVRRTVSDHRRALKTRAGASGALAIHAELEQPPTRTPLDLKEQSDRVKLLWDLLEELSWPKREVFMLAELEEMTAPEIAEALDIPLNTAYSRLRAARVAFEAALARRTAQNAGKA
jgi:RNA polymerase sigma-70 factor, ECF subfamily